jgi:hypothetical protein
VRILCIKAWTLWPRGRVDEHPAVADAAEEMARELGDPALLSQVLMERSIQESIHVGRRDVADRLADEALDCATRAKDPWAIAIAAYASAMAADSAAELRERVDRAAVLLERVDNVFYLAGMLAGVAYSALSYGRDRDARRFIERAMPIAERLDRPFLWMLVRGNFALTSLLTGDIDIASRAFRDELRLCRELVVLPGVHEALMGLAAVAAATDDLDRAARLAGAAEAHRYGETQDRVKARVDATFIKPARSRPGGGAWDRAFREGATLSFKHAVAYGMDEASA